MCHHSNQACSSRPMFSFCRGVLEFGSPRKGGANGCLLKSWATLRTPHEHTFGWMLEYFNIFTCMFSCGSNFSHSPMGKVSDTPLRAPLVCAFQVFRACSTRFCLCWPFGTSSYSNSFSFMDCLNYIEHSLSITCFLGLIPAALSRSIKIR